MKMEDTAAEARWSKSFPNSGPQQKTVFQSNNKPIKWQIRIYTLHHLFNIF